MSIQLGLIAARSKPEAHELRAEINDWLQNQPCRVIDESGLEQDENNVDVLITIGGDGLIMRMAHVYPNIPILGINVGKIGFLAMIERSSWKDALKRVLAGDYSVQSGPTLAAGVQRENEAIVDGWAVNDVVIRAGNQMVDVEVYIDHQFVNTYPGDGMIVATPQGSTAYCMAAGGPVLGAGVRGFAVVPICPHSPIRTTLVVPEESLVELVVANRHPSSLILDGHLQMGIVAGDIVRISRAPSDFCLVMLDGSNFYQAFRDKFNYMIRPHAVPTLGNNQTERAKGH